MSGTARPVPVTAPGAPFTFRSVRRVKIRSEIQAVSLAPIKCHACPNHFVPRPGGTAIWCNVCRGKGR